MRVAWCCCRLPGPRSRGSRAPPAGPAWRSPPPAVRRGSARGSTPEVTVSSGTLKRSPGLTPLTTQQRLPALLGGDHRRGEPPWIYRRAGLLTTSWPGVVSIAQGTPTSRRPARLAVNTADQWSLNRFGVSDSTTSPRAVHIRPVGESQSSVPGCWMALGLWSVLHRRSAASSRGHCCDRRAMPRRTQRAWAGR